MLFLQGSIAASQPPAESLSRAPRSPKGVFDITPAAATLPASASAVSIAATLSDISEGEEEAAAGVGHGDSVESSRKRQRVCAGQASGGCEPHHDDAVVASPEPVKRCRSPDSNNAVPWRLATPRAAVPSSRLDCGA